MRYLASLLSFTISISAAAEPRTAEVEVVNEPSVYVTNDVGVEVVLTPRQAPNCNAFAERFVLSIKSECLDRMIFFGESRFRAAERAHQGIGNERIEQRSEVGDGEVHCTERLGGLLKCYRRVA